MLLSSSKVACCWQVLRFFRVEPRDLQDILLWPEHYEPAIINIRDENLVRFLIH